MNGAGDVVALEGSQLVQYAPGSSQGVAIVDSSGNPLGNVSQVFTDGSGAVFVLYNQRSAFSNGQPTSGMVYSLARITPDTTQAVIVRDWSGNVVDDISNYYVDSTGSLVVLDGLTETLFRLAPGASAEPRRFATRLMSLPLW